MAMTKKEQAEVAALKNRLSTLAALRWTEAVDPDIPIPDGTGLAKGWLFNGYGVWPRAEKACSSSVYHSFGSDDKTSTQGARQLYSTKLLALKAMRHEIEIQCAKKLLSVDLQIAAEKGVED